MLRIVMILDKDAKVVMIKVELMKVQQKNFLSRILILRKIQKLHQVKIRQEVASTHSIESSVGLEKLGTFLSIQQVVNTYHSGEENLQKLQHL